MPRLCAKSNLLAFFVLLGVALVTAAPRLLSDAVWGDEIYVLIGSQSRSPTAQLPTSFTGQSMPEPSLAGTLRQLAKEDAYPPLVYVTLLALGSLGHPIFLPRLVFTMLSVVAALSLFRVAVPRVGERPALALAILSFASSPIVAAGTELKWTSVAPALMTLCALALMRALDRGLWGDWLRYSAVLAACLYAHYFLCFYVVGHGLFVLTRHRPSLWKWFLFACLAVLSLLPWLIWAIPQQREYVSLYFNSTILSVSNPNWRVPLSVVVYLKWVCFDVLVALGLQPSALGSRWLLPFVVVAILFLAPTLRKRQRSHAAVLALAVWQFVAALVGQTLYAIHLGHTTPLTWGYFVAAFPLLLFGTGLALWSMGARGRAVLALISVWTVGNGLLLDVRAGTYYARSINRLTSVSAYIGAREITGDLIVHRSPALAQLFNLFYKGNARQVVCSTECTALALGHATKLFVISPFDIDPLKAPMSATEQSSARFDRTVVVEYRLGHGPM